MKRIYLAGPMSGIPAHNFPAFHAAAGALRNAGFDVVNPAELNEGQENDWHACLRRDIRELVTCEGLALLPGWEGSKGAGLEWRLAHELGLTVTTVAALLGSNVKFSGERSKSE